MGSREQLTVDEKFAKALLNLRQLRPFYSAVYEAMRKVATNAVDSIGVSTNTMMYNEDFIDKRDYNEFLFILLHEIAHISLMHVARCEKRDSDIWNWACDLYVNRLLAVEFNLEPGRMNEKVKMPTDGMYTDTLDINTETTEEIYEVLAEQAKNNGYFAAKSDANNIGQVKTFHFEYTGTLSGTKFEYDIKCEYTAGGMNGNFNKDLMDNGQDQNQMVNDSKQILQEAKTRYDMQSNGQDTSAGNMAGGLLEQVTKLLKSRIDWRKLLRRYCIQYITKDSSYKVPDKRMYYQNAIYPGQYSDSEDVLKDVKVCIDTSGSISTEDLQYILGQVDSLMRTYKTKAEVLSWDTEVEGSFELDSIKGTSNQKSYNLCGRGGTNPKCLFDYFNSNRCKVKPFVTLIFTDGYFYTDMNLTASDKRKYKNTIWIMTRNYNSQFVPEVGKVAFADFSKESTNR